jgi:glycosyltransferase involved in cell wall biosynthesis
MNHPLRLAHLVSHPIQYFAPLYRELARRTEVDLTVFFYSDETVREFADPGFGRRIEWDVPLLGGYRHGFCSSSRRTPIGGGPLARRNLDLIPRLREFDVTWAHGYAHLTAWLAFLAARRWRKPFLLREEATLLPRRSQLRLAVKGPLLRLMFASAWGLYIGEQNRRYLEHYGMAPERMFPARYAVDNSFFRSAAERLRPVAPELKAELGLRGDRPVVLFCGKLTPKKQPLVLADAFLRLQARVPCSLLLVGDGELRPQLERVLGGRRDVVFAGFMNQTEIAKAYAASDVLVLPSAVEPWGLTVNEAMCFGLPIVVSDQVGCAEDLVRPGWNGFVVPYGDADALAGALETLALDSHLRGAFGARSLALIDHYSLESCADGIIEACLAAVGANRPRLRAAA